MAATSVGFARHDGHGTGNRLPKHLVQILIVGVTLFAVSSAALADPGIDVVTVELKSFATKAAPPLPDPSVYPVQLVLDDDNAEGVFGLTGGTSRQFLWFNRFANPGRFVLREIWVLFPGPGDVPIGGDVELLVYLDPDGDPANGAQLLGSFPGVVQAANGQDFSIYPLASPLMVNATGDVLIGVVNRYFTTGVTPPPTVPAALDTTTSQDRSYFALWSGDVPPSPDLASADTVDVLDGQNSGNFMIRGFGVILEPVPSLSTWGILVLIALVAVAGVSLARLKLG
jgi:hypothetical protein